MTGELARRAGQEFQVSQWSGATSWQLLGNDRKILDPKLALTWENGRDYMTLPVQLSGEFGDTRLILRCQAS